MRILVIGNGFDLAHGLKTKYEHFIEYTGIIDSSIQKEHFEELMKLDGDGWLRLFRDAQLRNKRWEGFEGEMTQLIQEIDRIRKRIGESNERVSIGGLQKKLISFGDTCTDGGVIDSNMLKEWKNRALIDLDGLTRQIEIYFATVINKEPVDFILNDIADIHPDKVVSFNYTDTYERLYKGIDKDSICYIHGKAKSEHEDLDSYEAYQENGYQSELDYRVAYQEQQCNLVLGIDEYIEDETEQKDDNEYIRFKKFYQRIVKGTGSQYRDWIEKCHDNNELLEVFFFGHSLAKSDKDILEELICADNSVVHFFYRDKESLGRCVENLIKIVNEKEVISRTRGSEATMRFIKQSGRKMLKKIE